MLNQNASDRATKEIEVRDLLIKVGDIAGYVARKWRLIAISALFGGVIGILYVFLKPVHYSAVTTFVLEENNKSGGMLGQYSGLASAMGVDIGGSGAGGIFQGDNILELYKSRKMLETALLSSADINGKQELLINTYIRINKLRDAWRDNKNLTSINFSFDKGQKHSRLQDSVITGIINEINKSVLFVSKPDKKLSIIRVEVNSKDETFSKEFNDKLVATVNNFYVNTKTKNALKSVAILKHQTDSVKSVLNGTIYQTAAVSDATVNLNPTRQILRAPVQRYQYNAETNKAILGELVRNLELAKMSLLQETPLIQVIDNPVMPLKTDKVGKTKAIIIGFGLFLIIAVFFFAIKYLFKALKS
jgi:hypothetical protein